MKHSTHVLIVYPHGNIATNPTMVALVQELIGRSVEVHLMTPTLADLDIWSDRSSTGRIHSLMIPPTLWKEQQSRFCPMGLLRAWKSGKLMEPAFKGVEAGQYNVIVGVDPMGICIAGTINQRNTKPMGYVSFELLFEREVESEYEMELKSREREAAGRCGLFMLQDDKRRDAFCEENQVDAACCELVPVSPTDTHPPRTNYLRERLRIGGRKSIVLYQGSLYDWSCRHEFEELVSYWRSDYCLVVHSRDRPGKRTIQYMKELSATGKIYFTKEPVSPSDLPLLTASADIGLASYRTSPDHWLTGDNLRLLGLSSGKISYYAMCGLPVMARYLEKTSEMLEQNGFGLSYRRLADSPAALEAITEARDVMSKAARMFYEQRLNPAKPIERFCDRLLALETSNP